MPATSEPAIGSQVHALARAFAVVGTLARGTVDLEPEALNHCMHALELICTRNARLAREIASSMTQLEPAQQEACGSPTARRSPNYGYSEPLFRVTTPARSGGTPLT